MAPGCGWCLANYYIGHGYLRIKDKFTPTPFFFMQNPAASGIHRGRDSSISDRDYTLSFSKLALCPDSDVAARCEPLKHDNSFESVIIGIAAIDLKLVRLSSVPYVIG
jgi:hypothetical protein